MMVTEEWVVTWFPPEVAQREFRTPDEQKARKKAATPEVAEWFPILEFIRTETQMTSTLVPLEPQVEVEPTPPRTKLVRCPVCLSWAPHHVAHYERTGKCNV